VLCFYVVEGRRGMGSGEGDTVSRYRFHVLFEIWDCVFLHCKSVIVAFTTVFVIYM
jgi:hypothetical protein